jgi:DNA-binding transcriptional LysR family regulator
MVTRIQTMMNEHVAVEADRASFSRRFHAAAQVGLKAPIKGAPKEDQNHARPWPATTQLRLMDLNLFRVFDAMMLHRSVRKASRTLSVTPSAVSHALARLRQSIGDELFISTESGMQPTRRALELASAVREGLEKLASALTGKDSVPAEAARTFRIGATDYACMVILPSLVKGLAKSAPNVDLRVFSSNHLDLVQQLEKGRADLVIGSFSELPAGIRRARLLREDEVIVVRTGHPFTRGKMTKDRLLEVPHVVVDSGGTMESATDGFPDEEGNGKRVSVESALREFQSGRIGPGGCLTVSVGKFAAVAPFLQLSDMLAKLPRRLALWAAAHAPLTLLDPPYPPVAIDIEMLWQGGDDDRGIQWLVDELAECIGNVG